MPRKSPEIFLDTSVIIAALFSATGGARMLFRLGEAGVVTLVVGKIVLQETDDVLLRKAPELRALLAQLLDAAQVKIGDDPQEDHLDKAAALMAYAPDAQVLAEALQAAPDWFTSHDREHFLDNPDLAELPFQIGSPGDALAWIRTQLET
ncbi:MAG: PIN domain-containing protein [Chloroflexi bacterium]|nr:PIN domain-containing protein [Chloroflexota bacterium]